MQWYQSKYVKAAGVAFATGLISAVIIYLGIVDDLTLTTRQVIKITGLAFMAPFATLIRFLPSFQDILGNAPQVNVQSAPNMTLNTEAPHDTPPAEPAAPAVTMEPLPPPAITPAVKVPRPRT